MAELILNNAFPIVLELSVTIAEPSAAILYIRSVYGSYVDSAAFLLLLLYVCVVSCGFNRVYAPHLPSPSLLFLGSKWVVFLLSMWNPSTLLFLSGRTVASV